MLDVFVSLIIWANIAGCRLSSSDVSDSAQMALQTHQEIDSAANVLPIHVSNLHAVPGERSTFGMSAHVPCLMQVSTVCAGKSALQPFTDVHTLFKRCLDVLLKALLKEFCLFQGFPQGKTVVPSENTVDFFTCSQAASPSVELPWWSGKLRSPSRSHSQSSSADYNTAGHV